MKLVVPDPTVDADWMAGAACKGKADLFWPAHGGFPGAEARAICDECPVLRACNAYANAAGVEGFWAGRWRRGGPA